ncbi:MAG: potassium-transporting ATPase subunit C [Candidatus Brocadiia bacterium]
MRQIISRSLELLLLFVIICCVIYPAALWAVGQTLFQDKANGSLVKGPDGAVVGSLLIAQPFTKDEYFQPRPSACSYDGSASSSSALAASNYALRGRVAAALGPIAAYQGGPNDGKPVAPDIEAWFQKDQYQDGPNIVAQWADAHNGLAQAWVGTTFDAKNPTPQQQYVLDWEKTHAAVVAKFRQDNPAITEPAPSDLAVLFFEAFSKENPGRFLSAVTANGPDGKPVTKIQVVMDGADVQSNFFDLWRQEHPDIALQDVPGDLVTTSASGLDPHITLQNAEYQLDRVASKWAADLKRNPADVRQEIAGLLKAQASAPLGGLAGEPFVNVLDVNLQLRNRYGTLPQ